MGSGSSARPAPRAPGSSFPTPGSVPPSTSIPSSTTTLSNCQKRRRVFSPFREFLPSCLTKSSSESTHAAWASVAALPTPQASRSAFSTNTATHVPTESSSSEPSAASAPAPA